MMTETSGKIEPTAASTSALTSAAEQASSLTLNPDETSVATQATNVEQQAEQQAAPQSEPQGIGNKLRFHREKRGLTIDDISQALKIRPNKVLAIEAEQWDALPTGPYLRGFLRNYAKVLHIGSEALIVEIDASLTRTKTPDSILRMPQSFDTPLPRQPYSANNGFSGKRILFIALVLLFLLGLTFWWGSHANNGMRTRLIGLIEGHGPTEAPAVVAPKVQPDSSKIVHLANPVANSVTSPAPEAGSTAVAPNAAENISDASNRIAQSESTNKPVVNEAVKAPTSTTTQPVNAASSIPPVNEANLVLQFQKDAWVEVRQGDGKVLLSKINPRESQQNLAGTPPFAVVIGNANTVKLQYRGAAIDLSPYVRDNVARLTLK